MKAVTNLEKVEKNMKVTFKEVKEPELRDVDGVGVRCVLYD
ncbi:MAG: hypothetical protein ACOC1V_03640 [Candidatus Saliniplasma sp.]